MELLSGSPWMYFICFIHMNPIITWIQQYEWGVGEGRCGAVLSNVVKNVDLVACAQCVNFFSTLHWFPQFLLRPHRRSHNRWLMPWMRCFWTAIRKVVILNECSHPVPRWDHLRLSGNLLSALNSPLMLPRAWFRQWVWTHRCSLRPLGLRASRYPECIPPSCMGARKDRRCRCTTRWSTTPISVTPRTLTRQPHCGRIHSIMRNSSRCISCRPEWFLLLSVPLQNGENHRLFIHKILLFVKSCSNNSYPTLIVFR